jgi:hypothetical protein
MKNIHLIKTDNPSRLHFGFNGLFISPNPQISNSINSIVEGRNLYIANNEEIKEGWYFNTSIGVNKPVFVKNEDIKLLKQIYGNLSYLQKITLTTDTDLIFDGVQPIDDTFLEWFVNNSSCEFVEVERLDTFKKTNEVYVDEITGGNYYEIIKQYKIIIPQEELSTKLHKGEIVDESYPEAFRQQETLEKVALNYSIYNEQINKAIQEAVKFGANWQAQNKCFCETIKDKGELVNFLIVNALKLDDESYKALMSKLSQGQGTSGDVFDSEGVWLGRHLNK